MGLLSTTSSVTQYHVEGQLDEPIIEIVAGGLKKYVITEIDGDPADQGIGWTSFHTPYNPDFEGSTFLIGTDFIFSLRIDKKSVPQKLIKKRFLSESARRQKELDRDYLTKDEKKAIKDSVVSALNLIMPATPSIYDVVWQYEKGDVWFFSNLKSANEALESLFLKTFGVHLLRKIPYTMAAFSHQLSSEELDRLDRLTHQEQ